MGNTMSENEFWISVFFQRLSCQENYSVEMACVEADFALREYRVRTIDIFTDSIGKKPEKGSIQ
jgi:hypothetical protein